MSASVRYLAGGEALVPNTSGKWALFAFLFLFVARSAPSQNFQSEANQFVNSMATEKGFHGVALVARNGQVLFQKAHGNAVEEWSVPNDLNTKFELASLTKQFTGAVILLLAQAAPGIFRATKTGVNEDLVYKSEDTSWGFFPWLKLVMARLSSSNVGITSITCSTLNTSIACLLGRSSLTSPP